MRILVTLEVFDTIVGDAEERRVREAVGGGLQKAEASDKVTESGVYADARGGFLLVNVDSGAELQDLLGPGILQNCHVETHPIVSAEELGAYFERHPA